MRPTRQIFRSLLTVLLAAAVALPIAAQSDSTQVVDIHRGLVYRTGVTGALTLDLYLPREAPGPYPILILIPADRVTDAARDAYVELATYAAARGEMAAAVITYRGPADAPFPGPIDDARAAIRFLRDSARAWRLDATRVTAAGDAFGGYVATLLALTGDTAGVPIRAAAAISPVTDLENYAPPPDGYAYHYARFLRYPRAERPELWRQASPMTHAAGARAPLLVVHGADDRGTPVAHSARFVETLRRTSPESELMEIADAGADLLTNDRVKTRVARRTVAWLARAAFEPPAGVVMERDIVYASPGGRELRLDVFRPVASRSSTARPAIILLHGGGWLWGDKKDHWPTAAYLASRGFVTATVEYRLARERIYPAPLDDATAAVAWLRAHAARYGIDPLRIGAAGSSAGGHLVSMLGVVPADSARAPVVNAVAAIAAPVDLASQYVRDRFSPALLLGLGSPAEQPERWAAASPLTHVNGRAAPFLFLHGTADGLVLHSEAVEMARRLRAAGVDAAVHSAEGGPHDFLLEAPWRWPAVKAMEEFFARTLRAPGR